MRKKCFKVLPSLKVSFFVMSARTNQSKLQFVFWHSNLIDFYMLTCWVKFCHRLKNHPFFILTLTFYFTFCSALLNRRIIKKMTGRNSFGWRTNYKASSMYSLSLKNVWNKDFLIQSGNNICLAAIAQAWAL